MHHASTFPAPAPSGVECNLCHGSGHIEDYSDDVFDCRAVRCPCGVDKDDGLVHDEPMRECRWCSTATREEPCSRSCERHYAEFLANNEVAVGQ